MDSQLTTFAALTVVLWGLWGFFGKIAIDRGMPPAGIFVAEIVISAACAVLFVLFNGVESLRLERWNMFGVLSGLGLGVGLLFYYMAMRKAQASLIVPLTASYPLVSALLAHLILGERLRSLQWIGVLLIVIGTALLLWGPIQKHP